LKKHLSPSTVISCIALFVALSGAAYAATLGKNAVKTRNIANGAVTTPKLRSGAVTKLKLRNGAVTGAKVAPGAVGSTQLADGGVRSVDLGGGVVTTAKLKNGAVTGDKLANNAVTTSQIAADAVTTGKLQDGAVTGAKLAPSFSGQLVKNVSYVSKSSGAADTATETKTATAECPSGKKVIGGGAQVIGNTTEVAITKSAPPGDAVATTTLPVTWIATATDIGGEANAWSLEAFAVCAEF
jgi:trimeric autotransporter adhesin